jgi:hypothetical protein
MKTGQIKVNNKIIKTKIYDESDEISGPTEWSNKEVGYDEVVYIIAGKLNIRSGATLTIDDKTRVLLTNENIERNINYGQLNFNPGSKLKAGIINSYSIFNDKTINPQTIANNGGWCFQGNNCPTDDDTSITSEFVMSIFNGTYLGKKDSVADLSNDDNNWAAINIYNANKIFTCENKIVLTNCSYNLYLYNSNVEIKIINILKELQKVQPINVNCFVIDNNSILTISVAFRAVDCNTLFLNDINSHILIKDGAIINLNAKKAGANIKLISADKTIQDKIYLEGEPVEIKKKYDNKTTGNIYFYNANEIPVNPDEPIPIPIVDDE